MVFPGGERDRRSSRIRPIPGRPYRRHRRPRRPDRATDICRPGDTIIVYTLDRLGRNLRPSAVPVPKRSPRAFLTWAMNSGDLPRLQIVRGEPLTQRRRFDLVMSVLTSAPRSAV